MLFYELMEKTCYFLHEQLTFVNNKASVHQMANLSINKQSLAGKAARLHAGIYDSISKSRV